MAKESSQKLTTEDILDALLAWVEDNIEEAARGLELIIEKLDREGKWPPKAKG